MIRNAFFVMLMASFLFAQSVYAKCLYKGKEHILFDSIAVIDDKCANEMKAQNNAIDACAVVIQCRPVVAINEIEKGDFNYNRIISDRSVWVPNMIHMEAQMFFSGLENSLTEE